MIDTGHPNEWGEQVHSLQLELSVANLKDQVVCSKKKFGGKSKAKVAEWSHARLEVSTRCYAIHEISEIVRYPARNCDSTHVHKSKTILIATAASNCAALSYLTTMLQCW